MNPLQKDAHLFANGEFKAKTESYGICDIAGFIEWNNSEGKRIPCYTKGGSCRWIKPNDCTLIARPIEDMTDEEIEMVIGESGYDYYKCHVKGHLTEIGTCKWLKRKIKSVGIDAFLNCLSIGVYPFDQEHFDDGTVININDV